MAKACASQGSRNTGPSASRGTPGTAIAARMPARGSSGMSGALQIRLPCVDRDFGGRIAVRAPKLASIETHGVKPLRIFSRALRVAVGKHVAANHAFDGANVTTHISGQAGMCRGIDIPGPDAVAGFELGFRIRVAFGRTTAMKRLGNVGR